jgi:serine/threonine protein kinase
MTKLSLPASCIWVEAACLQLVGNYHPNIFGCLEVLQDDMYLYSVQPYHPGHNLGAWLRQTSRHPSPTRNSHSSPFRSSNSPDRSVSSTRSNEQSWVSTETGSLSTTMLNENRARLWFRQLLQALQHLQAKGVCHRDLNVTNILVDDNHNLRVVGFGLALRVPFMDSSNVGGIADVSEGNTRLLMVAQAHRGSRAFVAPELLEQCAFDGFAADLWSAGVLLFVFLVGLAPFKVPNASDRRFKEINRGNLKKLMTSHLTEMVSDAACDLLQNMLWRNPEKRLTLNQVLQHPWVLGVNEEPTISRQLVKNIGCFSSDHSDHTFGLQPVCESKLKRLTSI